MSEGVSGVVTREKRKGLCRVFGRYNGAVKKDFKPFTEGKSNSLHDYKNEVAVLEVLDNYRRKMPFSIPKLLDHGIYPGTGLFEAVAYIKMTALRNPMSEIDDMRVTPNQWLLHAQRAGRVLAVFHQLELTERERQRLAISPLDRFIKVIREHSEAQYNMELVGEVVGRLKKLEGPEVFVHGDMGKQNLFGPFFGANITGVCDFCFSGLGVKEIDIALLYPYDNKFQKAFLEGYYEAGGDLVNKANMAILKSVFVLIHKLDTDREIRQLGIEADTKLSSRVVVDVLAKKAFDVPSQEDSSFFRFDPQRFSR